MRNLVSLDYYCDRADSPDSAAVALNCLNSEFCFHCKSHYGAHQNWANMFLQTAQMCMVRAPEGRLLDFLSRSFIASTFLGAHVPPCMKGFGVRRIDAQNEAALGIINESLRAPSIADLCLIHRYSVLTWKKISRTLNNTDPDNAATSKRVLAEAIEGAHDIEHGLRKSVGASLEKEAVHG
jgi:hypothetical protein